MGERRLRRPVEHTPRSRRRSNYRLPAVDATSARLMGIDPEKIGHLLEASGNLGPIREIHIAQRGEPIAPLRTDFRLLDKIEAQRGIRLARS